MTSKDLRTYSDEKSTPLAEKAVKGMMDAAKLDEILEIKSDAPSNKYALFRERLSQVVAPHLTTSELAAHVVRTALEIEFGNGLAKTPQFAKMVEAIAGTIVTNPELRREVLAMVSPFIEARIGKRERSD